MRIISTANAGVIIQTNDATVGIDTLHDTPNSHFSWVSEETFEQINKINMDVIIYTHDHIDHFSKEMTQRYLEGRDTRVFAPFAGYELLEGEMGQKDMGAFKLYYRRFLHDGEKYGDVANIGVIIEIDAKRILTLGDAAIGAPGIEEFAQDIDIYLCNFPFVAIGKGRDVVAKIGAKTVVAYHLPYEEKDNIGYIKSVMRAQKMYNVPDEVFIRPMQCLEV